MVINMKRRTGIICMSVSFLLLSTLSSCSFMEGMGNGMASYMSGYPAYGMYGSTVPASWGNGYAGPTYSNDPVLNATIGMAQSDARLRSQGVITSTNNTSSGSKSTNSSSSDKGWYKCCADVANFGIVTYHTCANCGKSHQKGSGHQCKKK